MPLINGGCAVQIVLWIIVVLALLVLGLCLYSRFLAAQAEREVPQAGKLHPVPGGAIHYVESGRPDAPVVVLIHGISAQLQHFTYGVADLLAPDFRVITIDRPGCGYSVRERDDDAALAMQARMIGTFLDDLGVKNPLIAGHSLGGAVALAMALDRPAQTGALALIAPLTHVQDEVPAIFKGLELRTPFMRRFVGNTIAGPVGKATADKVIDFAFAPETPVPDFMTRAAAILGLRPKAFITASCDLVMLETAMPAQQARYGELSVPAGVLYGDGDILLSPEAQGQSMQKYGVSYRALPGRGHMLPITAPAETAGFIREIAARMEAA